MSQFHITVLGASDPEMVAIENLLTAAGVAVFHAGIHDARTGKTRRVFPAEAYRATRVIRATDGADFGAVPAPPAGENVILVVECGGPIVDAAAGEWYADPTTGLVRMAQSGIEEWYAAVTVVKCDHHRDGDPGFGQPPAKFMSASSIGQVLSHLGVEIFWTGGEWVASIPNELLPAVHALLPGDVPLVAAADHCLGAAYAGKCPGVDPDELMRWRAASRAQFQNRPVADVLEDIRRAELALKYAPTVRVYEDVCMYCGSQYISIGNDAACPTCFAADGGAGNGTPSVDYRDMRGVIEGWDDGQTELQGPIALRWDGHVPELPEGATRAGVAYIARPDDPGTGRVKITCSGSPEHIRVFMSVLAPQWGLTGVYGDPERGFAGGYEPVVSPAGTDGTCPRCLGTGTAYGRSPQPGVPDCPQCGGIGLR